MVYSNLRLGKGKVGNSKGLIVAKVGNSMVVIVGVIAARDFLFWNFDRHDSVSFLYDRDMLMDIVGSLKHRMTVWVQVRWPELWP